MLQPASPDELAEALAQAAGRREAIELGGHFSKRLMGGALPASAVQISTAAMHRVRQYEPRDLTISVEAGMSYCELSRLLAANGQMIPLDPPFADTATVGGVVAANCSGPRRRLYGTARDLVIGMEFATLEGKLVRSGGMVVKNVAGLDMAKLMVGSFGTLAAIAVVNFKIIPQPPEERTFRFVLEEAGAAFRLRDELLRSPFDFSAIDMVKSDAVIVLAVRAGGNQAAIARYHRELGALGAQPLAPSEEMAFWQDIQNHVPRYLAGHSAGAVVRTSCTLGELRAVLEGAPEPSVARAGSGVCYSCFPDAREAVKYAAALARRYPHTVVEFASGAGKEELMVWPAPGPELELMKRIKNLFDPHLLLNRGRLYNQI